ncbi:hypothetical protein DFH08DRAFT_743874 [Mycena albidolilacea]|uniref:DUF7779 domain-containing protein n=1 Tax=Mycena albidolilacea TaxID=1033008 RepID=A0AAD7A2W8_9AGAR|nr:hypothetical protein DFH08DRAFT_743874 [Mycena albidolilacea]
MSTSRPQNAPIPTSSQSTEMPCEASPSDWLANSLLTARMITAAAECAPFPYVKGVFGAVVVLLETVEKVKKNRDSLKELCENITEIIGIVQDEIATHGNTSALKFKGLCEQLQSCLGDIFKTVQDLTKKAKGFRGRLKEILKTSSVADTISTYQGRIQELRLNFLLQASVEMNFRLHDVQAMISPHFPVSPVIQRVKNFPPASPIFQGRQNILDQMQQFFSTDSGNQKIFLLYGLGGAGKSQIALKFAEDSAFRFSDMFMVDTTTTKTIETGLKNIVATKNCGTTWQDALKWLVANQDGWLLFFDNADDPTINLYKFFPKCKHGNILITSRNPGLCPHVGSHSLVSDLEETDAVQLLLRSASKEVTDRNRGTATGIVKALSCFPLAIIQAGAFIAKSQALEDYLELYLANRARLLSEKPTQSHDDYAWTVYTTWKISFDQLSKPAAMLFQLCSFLHHERISQEIFSDASKYEFRAIAPPTNELQHALDFLSHFLDTNGNWDPLCFIDTTTELTAYSLINFDDTGHCFSIHPLVHQWSQSSVHDRNSYCLCIYAIMGMHLAQISPKNTKMASVRVLPHIDSLLRGMDQSTTIFMENYAKAYLDAQRPQDAHNLYVALLKKQKQLHPGAKLDSDTVRTMGNVALTHRLLGRFIEAKDLEIEVLERQENVFGRDKAETWYAMHNLAMSYSALGQFEEAKHLQSDVLKEQKRYLGEDNPSVLWTMGDLALIYYKMGRSDDAQKLYVQVLKTQKKILGDEHPDTLQTMCHLAMMYRKIHKFPEAEKLYTVVLEKQSKIFGENHIHTLKAMLNLASVYQKLGQWKEAGELEAAVFEKQRAILGEEHPDTLRSMGNLATTYHQLGQLEKAQDLEQVALAQRKRIFGDHHPETLWTMGRLAATWKALGKLKEAEDLSMFTKNCYIERLQEQRKNLNDDHPDILQTMGGLAWAHQKLGELGEAEKLGKETLERRRNIFGLEHAQTLQAMITLAGIYDELSQFNQAEELQREVLRIQGSVLGEYHIKTLKAGVDLAWTYNKLGKSNEAESLFAAVLEKQKEVLGKDHAETLWTAAKLAYIYHQLDRFNDAERLEIEVLQKRINSLGKDHPDTRKAMEYLAVTYRALGKSEEAEELDKEVKADCKVKF